MTTTTVPVQSRRTNHGQLAAHWVRMPDQRGRMRLTMVWVAPSPLR